MRCKLSARRSSILLVDDNEFIQRLFLSILSSLGICDVKIAGDGAEGYEAFNSYPVDLIIVDWKMEPVSGPAFVKRVRLDDASPNPYVPILMITAHTDMQSVVTARDCGVNEFLAKPVSASQIYERVVRILEYARPFIKTKLYFGPDRRRHKDSIFLGGDRRKNEDLADTDAFGASDRIEA